MSKILVMCKLQKKYSLKGLLEGIKVSTSVVVSVAQEVPGEEYLAKETQEDKVDARDREDKVG